ncbi:MAG: hypothetical protein RJA76_329 [Bacteroidota bacterium]|jgi:5-formyltetrahydrofolate cyclo-ligase
MLKSELRKKFLEKRNQLTDSQFKELNESLSLQIIQTFKDFPSNLLIGSFLSINEKREINMEGIHEQLKGFPFFHRLCFPRVITDKKMDFFTLDSKEDLIVSTWGIPEPKEDPAKLIDPNEIQYLIIPLLAFDNNGHRVGYGKGFYDRYLANCSSKLIKIGLSLFDEICIIDDIESTDVPLDVIITPFEVRSTK